MPEVNSLSQASDHEFPLLWECTGPNIIYPSMKVTGIQQMLTVKGIIS